MTAGMRPRDLDASVRAHTSILTTLDPEAPLVDLDPLRALVGDARVVALGEGAHFVREFGHARTRIIRFLAERRGFTVVALEHGFGEPSLLAPWLRGADPNRDLAELMGALGAGLHGDLLRPLRRLFAAGLGPLEVVGIDLPTSSALRAVLDPVAAYVHQVDPDVSSQLTDALGIVDRIATGSAAVATSSWAGLDPTEQIALTAALTRLLLRFRALEPLYVDRGGRERYAALLRYLEAACHTDYMFGAMHRVFTGQDLPGDASVRDRYMAESVLWHLDRVDTGTRIVVVAHNNHIQKTPASFDGHLAALPMGLYPSRALGDAHRAVALTHTADHVPQMVFPAENSPVGFTVADTPLDPARQNVRALAANGQGLDRLRTQSAEMVVPVGDAFDAVLSTPTVTIDDTLTF